MSVRRFGVLLRGLPASARTWAKENGRWGPEHHLLALNAELTHLVHLGTAHFKGTRPELLRVTRPGDANKPKESGWADFFRMFDAAKSSGGDG